MTTCTGCSHLGHVLPPSCPTSRAQSQQKMCWRINPDGKSTALAKTNWESLSLPYKVTEHIPRFPWCPPTRSLHHQAEFLLPPGLLQPAAPGMSPLGPWQRLGRGLLRAHQDRPLVPNSQRGQPAGQSKWKDTRQPGASAWIVTRGSNSDFWERRSKGLIWKGECEALALRRNFWLGECWLSAPAPSYSSSSFR